METQLKGLEKMIKVQSKGLVLVLGVSLFAVQIMGCATNRTTRTTTTEPVGNSSTTHTTTTSSPNSETTTTQTTSHPVEKTTTVTEERRSSDGGIFGGFFHIVGEVLAFPFRVVASVFDAIF